MTDTPSTRRSSSFPAAAAKPAGRHHRILHTSIGPSRELVALLEQNPGAKISVQLPGDPGYRPIESNLPPAFEVTSAACDNHECPHCSKAFSVHYGLEHYGKRAAGVVVVPCHWCRGPVAVPVRSGLTAEQLTVEPPKVV